MSDNVVLRCGDDWDITESHDSETECPVADTASTPAGTPAEDAFTRENRTWGTGRGAVPAPTAQVATPRRRQRGPRFTKPAMPFPPRKCPVCDLAKIFETRNSLNTHMREAHDSFWSASLGKVCPRFQTKRAKRPPLSPDRRAPAVKVTSAATAPGPLVKGSRSPKAPVPLMDIATGLGWPPSPPQPGLAVARLKTLTRLDWMQRPAVA